MYIIQSTQEKKKKKCSSQNEIHVTVNEKGRLRLEREASFHSPILYMSVVGVLPKATGILNDSGESGHKQRQSVDIGSSVKPSAVFSLE